VSRRLPVALLAPAAVGAAFLVVPLLALVVRAPWGDLGRQLSSGDVLTALRLSLVTATVAAACCVAAGVPLAWVLARTELPGRRVLRALVTLPIALPPVVGGVALLLAFGRHGLLGAPLYSLGITLPFTPYAVVMAQSFVALPFCVLAVEGALRTTDPRYDDAAATLGASRWVTFRRVTLPLVLPGVVSGAVLAWARALGEFGATITFAGNFPGRTQTMPLAVYLQLEQSPQAAVALALVLLALSLLVLLGLRDRWLGVR
jgi:molybdate transport system permease protein